MSENEDVNREEFNRRIEDMFISKKAPNTFLLSRSKYNTLIQQVKAAKIKTKKTPADYRRAKRYDVIKTPEGERLIMATKPGQTTQQVFVTMDEIYDVVRVNHLKLIHGGRTRMMEYIKPMYKNVTAECVSVYLSMCKGCKNKSFKRGKRLPKITSDGSSELQEEVLQTSDEEAEIDPFKMGSSETLVEVPLQKRQSNPISEETYPELYSRGQIDILAVTGEETEEYKYMLVYRDFISKFTHLRALKTTSIEESVDNLLDIFLVFGAPNILQSKNGTALTAPICKRITVLCADIIILTSESNFKTYDLEGKTNEDILKKMNKWLSENKKAKWQKGLKFVQHSLNTRFHTTLCRTPSELVFGADPRKGIASVLPMDVCQALSTDSDLKRTLEKKEDQNTEQIMSEETLILPCDFIKIEAMEDEVMK
ncbi:SCAN domain-containing protein 3-like [Cydia pomonella]|uniref:SCAN domain-containing protein 3-like n=1 Tax=Cydia pomonella TaxID=82600 RepID=UPI002ADDDB73|nr:SCAN domain-containing protein 3-like [Cydia pomonella]